MRLSVLDAGRYYGRLDERRAVGPFLLCRTRYAPHMRIEEHAHDSAYLCLAITGSFLERSGREEREVIAGSAVLHRPGERHAERFGERESSCLNVSFAPAVFRNASWMTREGPARYATPGTAGALVGRLAHEFKQRDEASELAIEGLTMELLALFLRDEVAKARRKPAWMGSTIEQLRLPERVPLSELARTAGVHPATLAREFRRFQGCSLGEYRRRWRLARAIEALRTTDAPLAEIAARAGFADQSHLTRALRSSLGISPAAFRRQIRG